MSAVKKAVKKVTKFVKKHWKKIVVAAAVVFTAGLATVGTSGFSLAAQGAGGGFGGFLSAAGSTLKAGVASIGGTLGIGPGVTGTGMTSAFAGAPAIAGAQAAGAAGATLGTGAAAQSIGLAPKSAQAAKLAKTGKTVANAPQAAGIMSGGFEGAAAAGKVGKVAGVAQGAATASTAANVLAPAAKAGFLQSPLAQTLVLGGIGALSAMQQQRMIQEQMDAERPYGYWGADLRGENHLTPGQMWGADWQTGPTPDAWRRPRMMEGEGDG